ncbi:sugar ABC transporter ATP-binding protein [Aneurinibacillus sp. Ricciae_BoGa-3]|uniref:sugar ABC transporter ATP-binding protein n=1 Tax=Aneurinibacillus sp. Ricciae_BoGa-3 TaxID=3022697 RepID=UPI0023407289|nr:sugar ABC transporter ATP-binding protein [Aneurinibacillus sp. Ricciae_BoGa-3]WCK56292.1 sugar ABC transporter ATP-binding protein [Aneurinibacillus sp. Ricciae_BoGa-3]
MDQFLLDLHRIRKSFFGVKALDGVDLEITTGEVLAVLGENGAGKSTMMKIIAGVYQPDEGEIRIEGRSVKIQDTNHAQALGISIIHQEFNLIPYLSVAENIYLGREPMKPGNLFINWVKMFKDTEQLLKKVGLSVNPKRSVSTLSVAEQQMVEIAKSLSFNAKVIIMDEPTAALNDEERNKLFYIIKELKKDGVGIIYISHRMEEIFEICDSIMVLRDGKFIQRMRTVDTSKEQLISLMVGRQLTDYYPTLPNAKKKVRLEVKDLCVDDSVKDVSFQAYKGEILGIAGLIGSGRPELAKAIFGALPVRQGSIFLEGEKVFLKNCKDAIEKGIALVSDDRKGEGIVLSMSIEENLTLANLKSVLRSIFIDKKKQKELVERNFKALKIKAASADLKVEFLSGGNQQKVVLGKWLETDPKIFILNEPTRGIDIGAKAEIYQLMKNLVEQGVTIILISSELPELLGMSHRILVMHEGCITGEFNKDEATQEKIMICATGGENNGAA